MAIIFQNKDKTIGIIYPTKEALAIATIEQIAEKDVPYNLPYWIVEDADIPTDRIFRSAWEIDESIGEPHGSGGIQSCFVEMGIIKDGVELPLKEEM